jgi:hypothetical protein
LLLESNEEWMKVTRCDGDWVQKNSPIPSRETPSSFLSIKKDSDSRAALIVAGLTRDDAAVGFDDFTAEVKTNPCAPNAFWAVVPVVLYAEKLLKNALAQLRRNTRSGVRHGNLQSRLASIPGILHGRQSDGDFATPRRVLEGISKQVYEDDSEPGCVATHIGPRGIVDDPQRDLGALEAWSHRADCMFNHRAEIDALLGQP